MIDLERTIEQVDAERADLDARRHLLARMQRMQAEASAIEKDIAMLKGKEFAMRELAKAENTSEDGKVSALREAEKAALNRTGLENKLLEIKNELAEYEASTTKESNFNKYLCFSNIRLLLKRNPSVKLGQIEKDAGCQPGYMSRLEKATNSSEPSVAFVVAAAKALSISLDALLTVDLAELTPTETYLISFIQKLMSDTGTDRLFWNKETADYLNRMDSDINGYVDHPLFSDETFYEQGENGYPERVSRVVFVSNSFDVHTWINKDCYNLRLKNGALLYLMDISKSVHDVNDPDAYAKEMWIFTPHVGTQFLCDNRGTSQIANMVDNLFTAVEETMKHPRIGKAHLYALDAFMKGDVEDDPSSDDLPF